jgi:hypothetical protein
VVVGVIPAGDGVVGVSASVGAGAGDWAGGDPDGAWVGGHSGIGHPITTATAPGDPGATAIQVTYTTLPTEPTLPLL